ncbi:hypothetical protein PVL29_002515 [Vitis rotundifolia]|uniref:RNA polymerase II subunit A C-terminal domain phosphatase SSU72 n=1 Tax=Vitis rotundifolia TaxID=103349 RepID=A0AA39E883_VITRO|nr:hypothetical protein PVL29_002515 [Vitis rotundifolia]
MVCSSNQNRSMEAHFLLKKQGFDVSSYGMEVHFRTSSKHMFDDLYRKDPNLYPPFSISRFFLFVSKEKNISEGKRRNFLFF